MKKRYILVSFILLIFISGCEMFEEQPRFSKEVDIQSLFEVSSVSEEISENEDYAFYGSISREVLDNYLSRSITIGGMLANICTYDPIYSLSPPPQESQFGMMERIHPKFIRRAFVQWGMEFYFLDRYPIAKTTLQRIHDYDPEIVVQATIFEHVTPNVGTIDIPCWVFEEFDMQCEERPFNYSLMTGSCDNMPSENVPDISRLETQLWFFYLSKMYIDAGFEAIHLGVLPYMASCDPNYEATESVINRIRNYASTHARRGYVLLDAHTHGMIKDGHSLLDFNSFPMRVSEVEGSSPEVTLEFGFLDSIYGRSLGGITPSGWYANSLPYIVELDNFYGGPGGECPYEACVWGYDEISWFAHLLNKKQRDAFLIYAWQWIRENDPNGHLDMPGLRVIHPPYSNLDVSISGYYFAAAFKQVNTIRNLFNGHTTFCGDFIIQKPNSYGIWEECDDGNIVNKDGCSNQCRYEEIDGYLANPDFEVDTGLDYYPNSNLDDNISGNGIPDGWFKANLDSPRIEIDSTIINDPDLSRITALSGDNSLLIQTYDNQPAFLGQHVPITFNKTYVVSGEVRMDEQCINQPYYYDESYEKYLPTCQSSIVTQCIGKDSRVIWGNCGLNFNWSLYVSDIWFYRTSLYWMDPYPDWISPNPSIVRADNPMAKYLGVYCYHSPNVGAPGTIWCDNLKVQEVEENVIIDIVPYREPTNQEK